MAVSLSAQGNHRILSALHRSVIDGSGERRYDSMIPLQISLPSTIEVSLISVHIVFTHS